MSSTSAPVQPPSVPAGTALLGEMLDVPVDEAALSGRRLIVLPDIPVEGYGAETWHAFATLLVARVTELEHENDALRAGAMHPPARELLDLFIARIDDALPHLAAAHRDALTDAIASAEPVPADSPAVDPIVDPIDDPADTAATATEAPADEPVDDADDAGLPEATAEDIAAVAGTPEGVEFWDEADTHSLFGRLRRRRSRGRAASTDGPDGLADAA
jgi:hypothetical protein